MKKFILFTIVFLTTSFLHAQNEKNISAQSSYKKEIDKLSSSAKIQKAFEIIQELEPTSMKELIELTQIPAPHETSENILDPRR